MQVVGSVKRAKARAETPAATDKRDGDIIIAGLQMSSRLDKWETEKVKQRERMRAVSLDYHRKNWLVDENVERFSVSMVAT